MSEITKEVSIRRFCGSLARRIHLWRCRGRRNRTKLLFPVRLLKPARQNFS